jgi:hypothetical protein
MRDWLKSCVKMVGSKHLSPEIKAHMQWDRQVTMRQKRVPVTLASVKSWDTIMKEDAHFSDYHYNGKQKNEQ